MLALLEAELARHADGAPLEGHAQGRDILALGDIGSGRARGFVNLLARFQRQVGLPQLVHQRDLGPPVEQAGGVADHDRVGMVGEAALVRMLDDVLDDALAELEALEAALVHPILEVGVAARRIAFGHVVVAAERSERARRQDVEAAHLVLG